MGALHRAKVGKRESPVKGSWRQPRERKKDEGRRRQRMKATKGKQQGVQGAEGREGTGGQLGVWAGLAGALRLGGAVTSPCASAAAMA